jgi:hypothetical protein
MNTNPDPLIMEEFDRLRKMIEYENELINQRLTWFGTFQGLLLAAVAFAWDKDARALVWIFCSLGALVALSSLFGTGRANRAIAGLRAHWDKTKPKDYAGPDIEGVRSDSGFWWLMPGYALPFLSCLGWIAIALIHCGVHLCVH